MSRRLGTDRVAEARRAEAERLRHERRQAAVEAWGSLEVRAVQRTAMAIAAFFLDEAREYELADWLLLARPERARVVATGVAVHALRIGCSQAWDALMVADAADFDQADADFAAGTTFIWSPEEGDLL